MPVSRGGEQLLQQSLEISRSTDGGYNLTDLYEFPGSICPAVLSINHHNLVNTECDHHSNAELRATEFHEPGWDVRQLYRERMQRRHDEENSYQGEN